MKVLLEMFGQSGGHFRIFDVDAKGLYSHQILHVIFLKLSTHGQDCISARIPKRTVAE